MNLRGTQAFRPQQVISGARISYPVSSSTISLQEPWTEKLGCYGPGADGRRCGVNAKQGVCVKGVCGCHVVCE